MKNFENMSLGQVLNKIKELSLEVCDLLAIGEGQDYHDYIKREKALIQQERESVQKAALRCSNELRASGS